MNIMDDNNLLTGQKIPDSTIKEKDFDSEVKDENALQSGSHKRRKSDNGNPGGKNYNKVGFVSLVSAYYSDSSNSDINDVNVSDKINIDINDGNASNEVNMDIIRGIISDEIYSRSSEINREKSKSGKRTLSVAKWKRNIQQAKRQKGEGYKSSHSGEIVQPKIDSRGMNLCSNTCRYSCNEVNDETRKTLFDEYYAINQEGKDSIIFSCMNNTTPVRPKNGPKTKNRKQSLEFRIRDGIGRKRICKKAFTNVYSISRAIIDRIAKSHYNNYSYPLPSKQGVHLNRTNRINDVIITKIREHILSFPSESYHYAGNENPHKKFLSSSLSITKMYNLCMEEYGQDETMKCLKLCTYRNIFNSHFNLGFGNIRTDVCRFDEKDRENKIEEHHKQL